MGPRLVTQQDIDANPELIIQGVSVNQMYDFHEDDVLVNNESEENQDHKYRVSFTPEQDKKSKAAPKKKSK